ncbi:hypothetical protein D3C83_189650 [compost metagenome]
MAGMADPECTDNYDGPGLVGCWVTVSGDLEGTYCGVACRAPSGLCPASTCDGTCPGDLVCGAENDDGVAFCG